MKVKQLIEELSNLDQESEIIISSDPEGNHFSPFSDWSIAIYKGGEVYDVSWTADDGMLEEEEWEFMLDTEPRSVVFWP